MFLTSSGPRACRPAHDHDAGLQARGPMKLER